VAGGRRDQLRRTGAGPALHRSRRAEPHHPCPLRRRRVRQHQPDPRPGGRQAGLLRLLPQPRRVRLLGGRRAAARAQRRQYLLRDGRGGLALVHPAARRPDQRRRGGEPGQQEGRAGRRRSRVAPRDRLLPRDQRTARGRPPGHRAALRPGPGTQGLLVLARAVLDAGPGAGRRRGLLRGPGALIRGPPGHLQRAARGPGHQQLARGRRPRGPRVRRIRDQVPPRIRPVL